MKVTYDREQDALSIDFREADYDASEEIYPGFVIDFEKMAGQWELRCTKKLRGSSTFRACRESR